MTRSNRSVHSQADASESHSYESFSVQKVSARSRSRPRGFQPSEVRKPRAIVEALSGSEAGEIPTKTVSRVASHRSHQVPLSRASNGSQDPLGSPNTERGTNMKAAQCDAAMPSTPNHKASQDKNNSCGVVPDLTHSEVTSPATSGESSSVKIITDEQKPSCWTRATGSATSPRPRTAGKGGWDDSFQDLDRPTYPHNRGLEDEQTHQHSPRVDFAKLPKYRFPGGSKKAAQDAPDGSLDSKKASMGPQSKHAMSTEGPLAQVPPSPGLNAKASSPAKSPKATAGLFVPPHLRAQADGSLKENTRVRGSNDGAHDDAMETARTLAEMKASLPPRLSSSRKTNEHWISTEAKPESLGPVPEEASLQKVPNLHHIAELKSHANNGCLENIQEVHPADDQGPAPKTSRGATKNDEALDESNGQQSTEAHHLGSGIDVNITQALPDVVANGPDTLTSDPVRMQAPSPVGPTKLVTRGRTSHAKKKKAKKPMTDYVHYETYLQNWDGTMAPAPIGYDWDLRDGYHNPDERLAVLKEYTEDQAVDPDAVAPAVDINSPSFLAGHNVQGDELGPDEEKGEKLPLNGLNGRPTKADQTAADAIRRFTPRSEKSDAPENPMEAIALMTKEQKRELRRALRESEKNFVPRPNPHAPKANIYLRPVELKDARQVTDLWNHYVHTSAAVPLVEPDTQDFWRDSITAAKDERQPFIVAVLMGDKASRNFREVRRLKQEHIVGFARTNAYGMSNNAYRFTVELEVYVQDGHLHKGIGKTLFDRVMSAIAVGYCLKDGAPFLSTDGVEQWTGGGHRIVKTILFNILHHEDDKDLPWKKQWLEREYFQQSGFVPQIAYKFGKA